MSGHRSTPATDPTQRMAELEQLGQEKPAEIVGHLAATEDACLELLNIIDSLTEDGARVCLPPKLGAILLRRYVRAGKPFSSPNSTLFRRGYERQIARLEHFV